jgi:succinate dehydrogenase/fumarate reductase flavoprotein subunit
MEAGMGVYRAQEGMAKTVAEVQELKARWSQIGLSDTSRVFNTEIVAAMELRNLLDVAEANSIAGLQRKESRGAHACKEFPTRNDNEYMYHALVYYDPEGGPGRFDKKDVTLGIWEPEERKY